VRERLHTPADKEHPLGCVDVAIVGRVETRPYGSCWPEEMGWVDILRSTSQKRDVGHPASYLIPKREFFAVLVLLGIEVLDKCAFLICRRYLEKSFNP